MHSKQQQLDALAVRMITDTSLPLSESNFVFGEGDPSADVLFVGEAPGANEDIEKRPFVGRAGQLLRRHVRDLGWRESEVYITNIVKRRPPGNRDPLPEELAAYAPYLAEQVAIINPVLIVPLGRFSMNFFLPDAKITRDQGTIFRAAGRLIFPMLHPAAAMRSTQMLTMFEGTFRKLPRVLEQCRSFAADRTAVLPVIVELPADGDGERPSSQPSLF